MARKNHRLSEADLLQIGKQNPQHEKQIAKLVFKTQSNPIEFIPVLRDEKEASEQQIQSAYFEWVLNESNALLMPNLNLIFSIPNGTNKSVMQRFLHKKAGLRSGIPDIQIAVSRKPFFGMFVEVKTWKAFKGRNHGCSDNQIMWHERLRNVGWKVSVLWSVSEMISETKTYLGY